MPISLEQLKALSDEPGALGAFPERFGDVSYGPEFTRISALPRRPIPSQDDPAALEIAAFCTEKLAKVEAPYPGPLKPIQGLALKEAWENNGGVGMIKVGGGKSLVAFLLPEVLGAARPLIVTKAMMIKDMEVERRRLRDSWHIRPAGQCPIISYETLSSLSSGEVLGDDGKVAVKSRLARMAPTHIIFDEAHCLADSGSVGARRVKAYLEERPETVVWAMTGTPFKKSIKDAAHLFQWALKDRCPLPVDFHEREAWAGCLDARGGGAGGVRVGPGALMEFLTPEEAQTYEELDPSKQICVIRGAVARRILETPGVVGTQDPPLSTGLEIEGLLPQSEDSDIEELFRVLRGVPGETDAYPGWRLPDGTEVADGITLARHLTTAGYGFWGIWAPEPPKTWRFFRNQWSRWCRQAIRYNRMGIESEARMKNAVRRGLYSDVWTPEDVRLLASAWKERPKDRVLDDEALERLTGASRLRAWEAEEEAERKRTGLREPPSVAVWASEQIVEECVRWLESVGNGVIWVNSIGLGQLLEVRLGVPYYGAGGLDTKGRHIKNHPGGPAIASLKANGTGRNLQGFWSKALWLCSPSEQSLGRLHRQGQEAESVKNYVYIGCPEHLSAFHSARSVKADFAQSMSLSPQKLCYASTRMPAGSELTKRGGSRWSEENS